MANFIGYLCSVVFVCCVASLAWDNNQKNVARDEAEAAMRRVKGDD